MKVIGCCGIRLLRIDIVLWIDIHVIHVWLLIEIILLIIHVHVRVHVGVGVGLIHVLLLIIIILRWLLHRSSSVHTRIGTSRIEIRVHIHVVGIIRLLLLLIC